LYQINLDTLSVTKTIKGQKPTPAYDIASDSKNNLYGAARASTYIWHADAKTGQVTYFDIRKRHEVWVALAAVCVEAKRTKRIACGGEDSTETSSECWTRNNLPGARCACGLCRRTSSLMTRTTTNKGIPGRAEIYADRVARLNVESGEWVYYLLPFTANIRDIDLKPAQPAAFPGCGRPHA